MLLLLRLIVAHLLGDFLLQPSGWAARKRDPGILARHLITHATLLTFVVISSGPTDRSWLASAGLVAAHGIIDWVMGGSSARSLRRLITDQTLHGASILACFGIMSPSEGRHAAARAGEFASDPSTLTFAAGALVSVWVGRYVIGALVTRGLSADVEESRQGLEAAGSRIGMLERLLIFLALVFRQEALAGFVIGAKALLRLPEATESKSRALAEYFLLGTLASVAWAVSMALLTRALMESLP